MKLIITAILILSFRSTYAKKPNAVEIYNKLMLISTEKNKTFPPNSNSFMLNTEVEKAIPPGWNYSFIQGFYQDKKLKQLALSVIQCGVEESEGSQTDLQSMTQTKASIFLKTLNLSGTNIDWEGVFKSLGPDWTKQTKIFISQKVGGIRRLRLSRGPYKCDSKGGHGFRFDLFF